MNNDVGKSLIRLAKEMMLADGDNDLTPDDVRLFCESCADKMVAKKIKTVKAKIIRLALDKMKCANLETDVKKALDAIKSPRGKLSYEIGRSVGKIAVHPSDDMDLGVISSVLNDAGFNTSVVTLAGKKAIRVSCEKKMQASSARSTDYVLFDGNEIVDGPSRNKNDLDSSLKKGLVKLYQLQDVPEKIVKKHGISVKAAELSPKQKEYRDFFMGKMEAYGVNTPASMDKETKKKFFTEISNEWKGGKSASVQVNAELSEKQKKYQEFFTKKMQEYNVGSPSEMDEETKKKFFNEIDSGWTLEDEKTADDPQPDNSIVEHDNQMNNQMVAAQMLKLAKSLLDK